MSACKTPARCARCGGAFDPDAVLDALRTPRSHSVHARCLAPAFAPPPRWLVVRYLPFRPREVLLAFDLWKDAACCVASRKQHHPGGRYEIERES